MSFKQIKQAAGQPVEITSEHYQHMFTVVPPKICRGFFAMGEPAAHTEDGRTVYYWATERGERHFACYGTREIAEQALMRAE